ncbi:MAG: carboxypeptidase regulatory-like domain-containing protein, partial [Acidobacteriaceae bacterium]|nr:carboxypeptidase regulatory-like domain-containing protein [Acidobacteriaceae bacterium]
MRGIEMRRGVRSLGYGLLLLFLAAGFALGQLGTATIRGTVTDTQGAVVPGARVEVKNVQTGVTTALVTDSDGLYVAPSLPIGEYQVQVQMQGFETALREKIALAVGEQRQIDIGLQIGEMRQEVAVSEQAAQVETASSTVSGLIDQSQMRDLPLNGRNFEQLIVLTPGVVPVTNAASSAYIGRS